MKEGGFTEGICSFFIIRTFMRCSKQAEDTGKWSNIGQSIVKLLPYFTTANLEGIIDYFLK
jgi:hypothetical protein